MAQFDLVVIKPVKNKPGERICGYTTEAATVTEAVKHVRELFDGSGYAVMQASQFNRKKDEPEQVDEHSVEIPD